MKYLKRPTEVNTNKIEYDDIDLLQEHLRSRNTVLRKSAIARVDYIAQRYGITKYKINRSGLVDVVGNVKMYPGAVDKRYKKLDYIALPFGRIEGHFYCHLCNLRSLKGAPHTVTLSFDCSQNLLSSLEYGPEYVGRHFDCSYNSLTTLQGGPETVNGDYSCDHNLLTSLVGSPEQVRQFWCQKNNLTSLEGSPKIVAESFQCERNKLTSLIGGPVVVEGLYDCSYNDISNLNGCAKRVKMLDCRENKITVLEGGPDEIRYWLNAKGNKLQNLKGAFKSGVAISIANQKSKIDFPKKIRDFLEYAFELLDAIYLEDSEDSIDELDISESEKLVLKKSASFIENQKYFGILNNDGSLNKKNLELLWQYIS